MLIVAHQHYIQDLLNIFLTYISGTGQLITMFDVNMGIVSLRATLLNDLQVLDSIPSVVTQQLCTELEEAQVHKQDNDSSFAVICTEEQSTLVLPLTPCSQLPNSATPPCHQLPDAKSATPKSISVLPLTHQQAG